MSATAATEAVPAAVAADRRRARRGANRRRRLTVLAFLSPWLVGFSVFFGYPLVMSAWLSLHSYDLLTPARWVGLANYRYMFGDDPQIWPAVSNTLWLIAVSVPADRPLRLRHRDAADAGEGRRRRVPDRLLPARARAARGGDARVRLPAQPVDRPGERHPRLARDRGAALVQRPRLVEAVARDARPLGRRHDDDHLPRGDPRRAAAPLRVGRARRRERPPAAALGDAADDQPGDPLRRRPRRDRVAPVLHPGARRRERRGRVGDAGRVRRRNIEIGYPEGSTLFYPILVYNHGFRYFNMGYASAMAMLLLVVAFAVTAIIIWNSRRVVHYQGDAR